MQQQHEESMEMEVEEVPIATGEVRDHEISMMRHTGNFRNIFNDPIYNLQNILLRKSHVQSAIVFQLLFLGFLPSQVVHSSQTTL